MTAPPGTRSPGTRPPLTEVAAAPPRTSPWLTGCASGVAVLLAATPVSAVVQGRTWIGHAVAAVVVVVGVGLLAATPGGRRLPAPAVAAAQTLGLLVLLAASFTVPGVVGLLPGGGGPTEMVALLTGAGAQIDTGIAPVPATPEILFLITTALGLLAVAVHLAAVGAAAPAAAGVPLLAAFAVPAALTEDLLPWWAPAAAAAGFGLLLLAPDGNGRQRVGGAALVAVAVVVALLLGGLSGFVGTSGRFDGGGGTGGGSIGLSPFTALRGQLDQSDPVDLFEVRGLEQPTYLRALTLSDHRSGVGWQATRPGPGPAAAGPFDRPTVPGLEADVAIDNLGFRDYWLPLYGAPLALDGLTPDRWTYDESGGVAYASRPADEPGWRQRAFLPRPTPALLRAAEGADPGAVYSDARGVDQRVTDIAAEVTAEAGTDFDRALALQQYFTGPGSPFTYDLATAPPAGDDALVEFLTVGQVGYCEQFASAMAVMLRTVGVPARVAVGFTGGAAVGDARLIRTSDAHAWVEAWFPGVGWTTFDPTPLTDGRAIVPPYVAQALDESAGGGAPVGEDAQDPPPTPTPGPSAAPTPAPDPGQAAPAPVPATGGGRPLPAALILVIVVLVAAVLVVAVLVPALLRRRTRRTRLAGVTVGGRGAAGAAWAELLAESVDRGAPVPPTDTVRGAARRLVRAHRLDAPSQEALREVVGAVEASWFGDRHPAPGSLAGPVAAVRAGMAAGSPLGARSRLLPRSVLTRAGRDDAAAPRD